MYWNLPFVICLKAALNNDPLDRRTTGKLDRSFFKRLNIVAHQARLCGEVLVRRNLDCFLLRSLSRAKA